MGRVIGEGLYDHRLGYIDKTGKVKISLKFTFDFQAVRPRYFEDGLFVAIGNGKNLDVNFDRGLAAVKIPKTCKSNDENDCYRIGYVDTTGKLVFEFKILAISGVAGLRHELPLPAIVAIAI